MTTEQLLALKDELNARVDSSSDHLRVICEPHKTAMGLVSDEFRATDEYKEARRQFESDWNAMRSFNEAHTNNRELSDAIHKRWTARRSA